MALFDANQGGGSGEVVQSDPAIIAQGQNLPVRAEGEVETLSIGSCLPSRIVERDGIKVRVFRVIL